MFLVRLIKYGLNFLSRETRIQDRSFVFNRSLLIVSICLAAIALSFFSLPSGFSDEPDSETKKESTAVSLAKNKETLAEKEAFYREKIQPILATKCLSCHGRDEGFRESELGLFSLEEAMKPLSGGRLAIRPGNAEESELIHKVTETRESHRMPPVKSGPRLTASQVADLKHWINSGAHYAKHWSFVPPVRSPLPKLRSNEEWCRNPIDRFVLAKMQAADFAPEKEATRPRLLRRLSLDLIGLPPTLEEVDAFVNDKRPGAYERAVDRLLASPRFGEHWARKWLDLARYADSQGYAQDELRTIWRYRDWVIEAFNRDMPFDQFTIEQLAGDMLPNATLDQKLATAFHRNTMNNTEGGTDDEEFRFAAVVDRTNTTIQVWMGLTMGCAQCHSHKYDPITDDDYYRVFAVFNQTEDCDTNDNRPTMPTPTKAQQARLKTLHDQLKTLEGQAKDAATDKQIAKLKQEIAALQKQIPTTPIMRELQGKERRPCYFYERGSHLSPGKKMQPGTLASFQTNTKSQPKNRLELARWLVAKENPLTARVEANRIWEQLFGIGLVETSEDFGAQGAKPSHPKLLDWLALEFIDGGWSRKKLIKKIVTSATYRQASIITPDKLARDGQNRLLTRGARYRLSAEQIRDQALQSSGLLSAKMFGPSVRPLQPKSGLGAAFGGSLDWEPSPGEDRYRRGLYTLWRRTAPYPSMMALDATNRTACTVRRIRTNTPVGAFVTMNDPVFIEAAQALARKMMGAAETNAAIEQQEKNAKKAIAKDRVAESIAAGVVHGFRRVLARTPSEQETARLVTLFQQTKKHYETHPKEALQMATNPLGPLPKGVNAASAAAWTVVANTLLNLDEVLTRN